jgi:hypothetical protein
LISPEVTLEDSKISMSVSSSRIYSRVASESNLRILFSKSLRVLASAAIVRTI